MKKILLLCVAFIGLLNTNTYAQLTLSGSNYNVFGTTMEKQVGIKNYKMTLPTWGTNQKWDFSKKLDSFNNGAPVLFDSANYTASSNSFFPAGTLQRSFEIKAAITAKITIKSTNFEYLNSTEHAISGFTLPRQGFSLSAQTLGPFDSLVFPAQSYLFKSPLLKMKLPTTMGTSWSCQVREVVNFNLTVSLLSINKAPGQRVANITAKDTVVAWGTLVSRANSGKATIPYDVIVKKEWKMSVDSFYLNGAAAASSTLAAFGLKQADTTQSVRYAFYRANASNPLMVIYSDKTGNAFMGSSHDPANLTESSGIGNNEFEFIPFSVSVFPNPASNGQITMDISKPDNGRWTILVTNALGQTVKTVTINKPMGSVKVALDIPGANGMYFYSISNEVGNLLQSGKFMMK